MDDRSSDPHEPGATTTDERTQIDEAGLGDRSAGPLIVRWHDGREAREETFHETFTIGRARGCEIRLADSTVSRKHARFLPRAGRWHLEDLGSGNGTWLDDLQVSQAVLPQRATVQLGSVARVAVEALSTHEALSEEEIAERYFGRGAGDAAEVVGGRTEMLRVAYRKLDRAQKRRYRGIIAAVVTLLAISGYVAYQQHQTLQQTRALATEIFYAMKEVEIQVAELETRVHESGDSALGSEMSGQRREIRKLEAQYDRFLEELDVLGPHLSPEDRVILRVARLFGECELTMPEDFVREVKRYVHEWRLSPRLRNAIALMEQGELAQLISGAMLERGLPPQYLYVALQESSFDPDAVGPRTRFGVAKGMWQFIPSTARRYGLRTGPLVELAVPDENDDRHDTVKATRAAADYLHDIYARDAQASGLLVMASYNWGPNNVRRRIRNMPENPRERNFWKLLETGDIPKETYDYVFHIVSAAVIGEDPELFGFTFTRPLAEIEAEFDRPEATGSGRPG